MLRRRALTLIASLVALVAMPAIALPFGTIHGDLGGILAKFYGEHQMITRAALACNVPDPVANCFQEVSLDNLAGTLGETRASDIGNYGGVGSPDNYSTLGGGPDYWHCDGADAFADVFSNYPVTTVTAWTALYKCRRFVQAELTDGATAAEFTKKIFDGTGVTTINYGTKLGAVSNARFLLERDGTVDKMDLSGSNRCTFIMLSSGRAKCDELEAFGRALHAVQDFYSHSNYADTADPALPQSLTNPPGVGMTTLADFWDLSNANPVMPRSLGSGCYPDTSCANRVTHDKALNKDTASIDWRGGSAATVSCTKNGAAICSTRGLIGDNEANAVRLAILETRRQWAWLQQQITAREGADRSQRIICAITQDAPETVSNQAASNARGAKSDTAGGSSHGTARVARAASALPPLARVTAPTVKCPAVALSPSDPSDKAVSVRAAGITCAGAARLIRGYHALSHSTRTQVAGTHTVAVASGRLRGLRFATDFSKVGTRTGILSLRRGAVRVTFNPACLGTVNGRSLASGCGF